MCMFLDEEGKGKTRRPKILGKFPGTQASGTFILASVLAPLAQRTGVIETLRSKLTSSRPDDDDDGASSFRLALLARLSPLPSYVNNYGLALVGLPFRPYLAATVVAGLPSILTHVAAGNGLSSLLDAALPSPPGAEAGGAAENALLCVSVLSAGLLAQQLLADRAAAAQDHDRPC